MICATLFMKLSSGAKCATRIVCKWRLLNAGRSLRRCSADVFADIREIRVACQLLGLFRSPFVQKQPCRNIQRRITREFIAVQFCHATSQNVTHEKSRIYASRFICRSIYLACDRFPFSILWYRDCEIFF